MWVTAEPRDSRSPVDRRLALWPAVSCRGGGSLPLEDGCTVLNAKNTFHSVILFPVQDTPLRSSSRVHNFNILLLYHARWPRGMHIPHPVRGFGRVSPGGGGGPFGYFADALGSDLIVTIPEPGGFL
jgi:hypothetical protein